MATMAADHGASSTQPTDAEAWCAVQAHDARYDGCFVYAVRTTGIYCRPSCASRRPLRGNVMFFATADAAERAGFRACKRCTPQTAQGPTTTTAAVERARVFLDANAERPVSLEELASHTGMSASHLQRSFKKVLGISPKQYQDGRRTARFKARLRAGDTVSRATYEAGFGSSSRVYERADAMLGMTPASYRHGGTGVCIRYAIADSPVGRVLVGLTDRGVCAVELGSNDEDVLRALTSDFPNATLERADETHHDWVHAVLGRVRNPRRDLSDCIPLDVGGTAFQRQVWNALREIPAGERRTYTEVAAAIGRPTATRAVARACATNRVAVVIPCHRVVRTGGALAGYKWGVDRKRRLLDAESSDSGDT